MKIKHLAIILTFFVFCKTMANKAQNEIALKTLEWNDANNTRNIDKLRELYDQNVIGYGQLFQREEFLSKKSGFFQKLGDYRQSIESSLKIINYKSGMFKCEFSKKANSAKPPHRIKTFPAYLIFTKVNGEFKITEEGDEITDYNINHHPQLGQENKIAIIELSSIQNKTNWWLIGMLIVSGIGLFIVIYFLTKGKSKKTPKGIPVVRIEQKNSAIPIVEESIDEDEFTDENKKKGRLFEDFITSLFNASFTIEHLQSDRGVNGRFAESNKNPDIVMRLNFNNGSSNLLAVECKYRSNIVKSQNIVLCKEKQLFNYKEFGYKNNMPVFLALGVGGKPDIPEEVYIVPIMNLKNNTLQYAHLKEYKRYSVTKFLWFSPENGTLE